MKTIHDVKQELNKLQSQLKEFDDDQHNFIYDSKDPEEDLLAKKVNGCLELVNDLHSEIKSLSSEIIAEGTLKRNRNGRYQLESIELTSGNAIEYWDDFDEIHEDKIEHFDGDYGLYFSKEHHLDGLYVRIRKTT